MQATTTGERPARRPRRSALRGMLIGTALAMVVVPTAPVAAAGTSEADPPPSVSTACGTPLSASEVRSVVALSDTSTLTGDDPLDRFDQQVTRTRRITAILVRHQDRRGLFAVGLDAMERTVMQPLLRGTTFHVPAFGHAFTPELLRRYLATVHDEFLGRPTPPHWKRYYDLAHRCDTPPARVAMAGYNAHLTVDIGHTLATVDTELRHAPDYATVTGALLKQNSLVVKATKEAYGVDLSGVWSLVATTGPVMYTIVFVNGLALQIPPVRPIVQAEIALVWRTTDAALTVATA
ncbi:DUF5995 family protein [Streptomyces smyrnaeus]|uniref:DUF5995 family protein n=1 Tax=Streptomyces smyrnaeus TaxID=1387713 RepID=UPI0036A1698A